MICIDPKEHKRISRLQCRSFVDCHDSEDLIRPAMLGERDDGGPRFVAAFRHIQHLVNLASDRAVFLEVPQLVGATMGLKYDHIAGLLAHIQHQSAQKDSKLRDFSGFW